ncbi:hypothetical protein ACVWY3_002336 [Bradyrhizobium sp. USDA 4486]
MCITSTTTSLHHAKSGHIRPVSRHHRDHLLPSSNPIFSRAIPRSRHCEHITNWRVARIGHPRTSPGKLGSAAAAARARWRISTAHPQPASSAKPLSSPRCRSRGGAGMVAVAWAVAKRRSSNKTASEFEKLLRCTKRFCNPSRSLNGYCADNHDHCAATVQDRLRARRKSPLMHGATSFAIGEPFCARVPTQSFTLLKQTRRGRTRARGGGRGRDLARARAGTRGERFAAVLLRSYSAHALFLPNLSPRIFPRSKNL